MTVSRLYNLTDNFTKFILFNVLLTIIIGSWLNDTYFYSCIFIKFTMYLFLFHVKIDGVKIKYNNQLTIMT